MAADKQQGEPRICADERGYGNGNGKQQLRIAADETRIDRDRRRARDSRVDEEFYGG